MMVGDFWLKYFVKVCLKSRTRPLFVQLAQAAIADDVGNKDSDEPALHAKLLWAQE